MVEWIKDFLKDHAIGLITGITDITSTVVVCKYESFCNRLFEVANQYQKLSMAIVLFIVCLCAYFSFKYLHIKRKLNEDYHSYLDPVPDQGYCTDRRNGQAVCPKCNADNRLSYMQKIVGNSSYPSLFCNACQTTIWINGCKPIKQAYVVD